MVNNPTILWTHEQFEPMIRRLDNGGWYCLVREGRSGKFHSLEGPEPLGYPTPGEALAAASDRLDALQGARQEALAVEAIRLLTSDPPRLRRALDPGAAGSSDRGIMSKMEETTPRAVGHAGSGLWQAQAEDGTWTEPLSIYKAVKGIAREERRSV